MPQEKGTIVIEKAVSQKKRHMVAGGEWGEGVTQEAPGRGRNCGRDLFMVVSAGRSVQGWKGRLQVG